MEGGDDFFTGVEEVPQPAEAAPEVSVTEDVVLALARSLGRGAESPAAASALLLRPLTRAPRFQSDGNRAGARAVGGSRGPCLERNSHPAPGSSSVRVRCSPTERQSLPARQRQRQRDKQRFSAISFNVFACLPCRPLLCLGSSSKEQAS